MSAMNPGAEEAGAGAGAGMGGPHVGPVPPVGLGANGPVPQPLKKPLKKITAAEDVGKINVAKINNIIGGGEDQLEVNVSDCPAADVENDNIKLIKKCGEYALIYVKKGEQIQDKNKPAKTINENGLYWVKLNESGEIKSHVANNGNGLEHHQNFTFKTTKSTYWRYLQSGNKGPQISFKFANGNPTISTSSSLPLVITKNNYPKENGDDIKNLALQNFFKPINSTYKLLYTNNDVIIYAQNDTDELSVATINIQGKVVHAKAPNLSAQHFNGGKADEERFFACPLENDGKLALDIVNEALLNAQSYDNNIPAANPQNKFPVIIGKDMKPKICCHAEQQKIANNGHYIRKMSSNNYNTRLRSPTSYIDNSNGVLTFRINMDLTSDTYQTDSNNMISFPITYDPKIKHHVFDDGFNTIKTNLAAKGFCFDKNFVIHKGFKMPDPSQTITSNQGQATIAYKITKDLLIAKDNVSGQLFLYEKVSGQPTPYQRQENLQGTLSVDGEHFWLSNNPADNYLNAVNANGLHDIQKINYRLNQMMIANGGSEPFEIDQDLKITIKKSGINVIDSNPEFFINESPSLPTQYSYYLPTDNVTQLLKTINVVKMASINNAFDIVFDADNPDNVFLEEKRHNSLPNSCIKHNIHFLTKVDGVKVKKITLPNNKTVFVLVDNDGHSRLNVWNNIKLASKDFACELQVDATTHKISASKQQNTDKKIFISPKQKNVTSFSVGEGDKEQKLFLQTPPKSPHEKIELHYQDGSQPKQKLQNIHYQNGAIISSNANTINNILGINGAHFRIGQDGKIGYLVEIGNNCTLDGRIVKSDLNSNKLKIGTDEYTLPADTKHDTLNKTITIPFGADGKLPVIKIGQHHFCPELDNPFTTKINIHQNILNDNELSAIATQLKVDKNQLQPIQVVNTTANNNGDTFKNILVYNTFDQQLHIVNMEKPHDSEQYTTCTVRATLNVCCEQKNGSSGQHIFVSPNMFANQENIDNFNKILTDDNVILENGEFFDVIETGKNTFTISGPATAVNSEIKELHFTDKSSNGLDITFSRGLDNKWYIERQENSIITRKALGLNTSELKFVNSGEGKVKIKTKNKHQLQQLLKNQHLGFNITTGKLSRLNAELKLQNQLLNIAQPNSPQKAYYEAKINNQFSLVQAEGETKAYLCANRELVKKINFGCTLLSHDKKNFILDKTTLNTLNKELKNAGLEQQIQENGKIITIEKQCDNDSNMFKIKQTVKQNNNTYIIHEDIDPKNKITITDKDLYIGEEKYEIKHFDYKNKIISFKDIETNKRFRDRLNQKGLKYDSGKICTVLKKNNLQVGTTKLDDIGDANDKNKQKAKMLEFSVEGDKLTVIKNNDKNTKKILKIQAKMDPNNADNVIITEPNEELVIQELENNHITIIDGIPYNALPVKPIKPYNAALYQLQNANGSAYAYLTLWKSKFELLINDNNCNGDNFTTISQDQTIIDYGLSDKANKLILTKTISNDQEIDLVTSNKPGLDSLKYSPSQKKIIIKAQIVPETIDHDKALRLNVKRYVNNTSAILLYGTDINNGLVITKNDKKDKMLITEFSNGIELPNSQYLIDASVNYSDGLEKEITVQFQDKAQRDAFAAQYGLEADWNKVQQITKSKSIEENKFITTQEELSFSDIVPYQLSIIEKDGKARMIQYVDSNMHKQYDVLELPKHITFAKDKATNTIILTFKDEKEKQTFVNNLNELKEEIKILQKHYDQLFQDKYFEYCNTEAAKILQAISQEVTQITKKNAPKNYYEMEPVMKNAIEDIKNKYTDDFIESLQKSNLDNTPFVKDGKDSEGHKTFIPKGTQSINILLADIYAFKLMAEINNINNKWNFNKLINSKGDFVSMKDKLDSAVPQTKTLSVHKDFITLLQSHLNDHEIFSLFGNGYIRRSMPKKNTFIIDTPSIILTFDDAHNKITLSGAKKSLDIFLSTHFADHGGTLRLKFQPQNWDTAENQPLLNQGLLYVDHIFDSNNDKRLNLVYNTNLKKFQTVYDSGAAGNYAPIMGTLQDVNFKTLPCFQKVEKNKSGAITDFQVFFNLTNDVAKYKDRLQQILTDRRQKDEQEEAEKQKKLEAERKKKLEEIHEDETTVLENNENDMEQPEPQHHEERNDQKNNIEDIQEEHEVPSQINKYTNSNGYGGAIDASGYGNSNNGNISNDNNRETNLKLNNKYQNSNERSNNFANNLNRNDNTSKYIATKMTTTSNGKNLSTNSYSLSPSLSGSSGYDGGGQGEGNSSGGNTPQVLNTTTNDGDKNTNDQNNKNDQKQNNKRKSYAATGGLVVLTLGSGAVAIILMNEKVAVIVGACGVVVCGIGALATGISTYSHNKKIDTGQPNTDLKNSQQKQGRDRQ